MRSQFPSSILVVLIGIIFHISKPLSSSRKSIATLITSLTLLLTYLVIFKSKSSSFSSSMHNLINCFPLYHFLRSYYFFTSQYSIISLFLACYSCGNRNPLVIPLSSSIFKISIFFLAGIIIFTKVSPSRSKCGTITFCG